MKFELKFDLNNKNDFRVVKRVNEIEEAEVQCREAVSDSFLFIIAWNTQQMHFKLTWNLYLEYNEPFRQYLKNITVGSAKFV